MYQYPFHMLMDTGVDWRNYFTTKDDTNDGVYRGKIGIYCIYNNIFLLRLQNFPTS